MKTRIADYIVNFLVEHGVTDCFTVVGVVGGWLDSIPMFIVSGQVRYDTTARYAERFTEGLPLRAVGFQEDLKLFVRQSINWAFLW